MRLRPASAVAAPHSATKKAPGRSRAKVGGEKEETPLPTRTDGCGAPSAQFSSVHELLVLADGALALAGAGRGLAQAAHVVLRQLIRMRDELAGALAAGGQRDHAGIDELHQAPGARHGQQRLQALRLDLLEVEL